MMKSLYLIARDPSYVPSEGQLAALRALLTGEDILRPAADGDGYEAGERFSSLLDLPSISGAVYGVDATTGERGFQLPDRGDEALPTVRVRLLTFPRPVAVFPEEPSERGCPACGADMELEAWRQAKARFDAGEQELCATCAACGAAMDLNALCYRPPGGFARFALAFEAEALSCYNLGLGMLEQIEEILGCALIEVASSASALLPVELTPKRPADGRRLPS